MFRALKLTTQLVLIAAMFLACTDTESGDEDGNVELTQLYTDDINSAPQFFVLESGSFSTLDYDLSFQSGGMSYEVALNSAAGVLAFATDTIDFTTSEFPAVGYSADSSTLVIGDTWVDESTYNPADHSVGSNNMIYFIRSTDYRWMKMRVISASPSAFSVEFAEYTTENGYGAVQSVSIPYSSTSPALYSLQSAGIVEKAQWDVIFATTPEFSTELQTNFYMPTILFNSDAGVKVGFVDDSDINDITTVPSSMEWISDTSWEHPFGNMGTHQVLVYHPEPPYNHQVIVEVPNRVYIIDTPSGYYKLQFEEYSSGIVVFSYAVL